MKMFIVLCLLLVGPLVFGQTLPTHDEVFRALYGSHYDSATGLATWNCPEETESAPDECTSGKASIAKIDLLLMTIMEIDGSWKAFVVTSAIDPSYNCHACAPPVDIGIFGLRQNKWQLEMRNETASPTGIYGEPATPELVKIGPKLYGVMFTLGACAQDYCETSGQLFAAQGKIIREIWTGVLDEDNSKQDPRPHRISVDAAFRFLPSDNSDHYTLQVVSHGYGHREGDGLGYRTGVLNYRYLNGTYQLIPQSSRVSTR